MSYAAAEQTVLESVGGFCKAIYPSYDLFLLDEDWPRIEGPYFGMQIATITKNGESDLKGYNGSNQRIHVVGYDIEVELIAFRGDASEKPMGMLTKVQQLIEDEELHHVHFTANNVGYTGASNITRVDQFLDATTKELRSRMRMFFNIQLEDVSTISSTPIETVNYDTSVDSVSVGTDTVTYP